MRLGEKSVSFRTWEYSKCLYIHIFFNLLISYMCDRIFTCFSWFHGFHLMQSNFWYQTDHELSYLFHIKQIKTQETELFTQSFLIMSRTMALNFPVPSSSRTWGYLAYITMLFIQSSDLVSDKACNTFLQGNISITHTMKRYRCKFYALQLLYIYPENFIS